MHKEYMYFFEKYMYFLYTLKKCIKNAYRIHTAKASLIIFFKKIFQNMSKADPDHMVLRANPQ